MKDLTEVESEEISQQVHLVKYSTQANDAVWAGSSLTMNASEDVQGLR